MKTNYQRTSKCCQTCLHKLNLGFDWPDLYCNEDNSYKDIENIHKNLGYAKDKDALKLYNWQESHSISSEGFCEDYVIKFEHLA